MNKAKGSIDWESIKENIFLHLVNYEKNKVNLEEKVYIPFLDLAILFYCGHEEADFNGFYVKKKHLLAWNQDINDLFRIAQVNTFQENNIVVVSVLDVLTHDDLFMSLCEKDKEEDDSELMMMLTNKELSYGAAMLTNTDALKKLADQLNSSLYLLPSSVHEIFAVCPDSATNIQKLVDMVKEANSQFIPSDIYLSDHVYYFDRDKCEVEVASPA